MAEMGCGFVMEMEGWRKGGESGRESCEEGGRL